MNINQAQETIMSKINDSSALFSQGYYILYFISAEDGYIYVYDTREPLRALKDIIAKNPLHEFLRVESYPNEATLRDICRVFRVCREATKKLRAESSTCIVEIKHLSVDNSAAAAATTAINSATNRTI